MILEADDAWRFIAGYKKLLLEIDGASKSRAKGSVVAKLAKARAKLVKRPAFASGGASPLSGQVRID
jgi:hypothetical protein